MSDRARRYVVQTQLDDGEPGKKPVLEEIIVFAYTAADAVTQVRLDCRRRPVVRYWVPGRVLLNHAESTLVVPVVLAVRPLPFGAGSVMWAQRRLTDSKPEGT